jgi:F-type H+-transporting ATPase subunit a
MNETPQTHYAAGPGFAAARSRGRMFATLLVAVFVLLAVLGFAARVVASRMVEGVEIVHQPEIRLAPDRLFRLGFFPVSNTLLSAWLSTLLLVAFLAAARVRSRFIPAKLRQTSDLVQEWLYELTASFAGQTRARLLYPVAATFFLFILVNAWIALLPFYGPVVGYTRDGERVPLLRGAGTDINMPFALAIVSFLVVQAAGSLVLRRQYLGRFFPLASLRRGQVLLGLVELSTGLMHMFTEAARVLSFTFRLFGTMLAGEVLLLISGFLVPLALSVPFYGLELVIGAVQAALFAALTVAFAVMAMTPEQEPVREA